MNKKNMLRNALVMTAVSLILRTAGVSYRAFMAEKVGTEGMGLYSLLLSVFYFAVTFSTAGIGTAVTRLVSEDLGRGKRHRRVMGSALVYALSLSTAAAVILFFAADFIGEHILNDVRTVLSLRILAPSLPCLAAAACFRGYFYAMRQAALPATSELLEQFLEMAVFVAIVTPMAARGIAYGCAAVVVGITASEIAACLYLALLYRFRRGRRGESRGEGALGRFLPIVLPMSASSCLGAGLRTVENILIPTNLRKSGATQERALSIYGMVRGMALPLLFFPHAFLSSFSALLIPEIAEARVQERSAGMHRAICRVMQICLLLSILVAGVFMTFWKELGVVVYRSVEVGKIMLILAPLTPLMYLDALVDGMLKGLNQQMAVLRYNIIDSVIRIAMIWYFIPAYGFYGFMIVMYVSNILNPVLSINKLLKVTGIRMQTVDWVLKPTLAAAVAGVIARLLANTGGAAFYLTPPGLTVGIAAVCSTYALLLLAFNCLSSQDVDWMWKTIRSR